MCVKLCVVINCVRVCACVCHSLFERVQMYGWKKNIWYYTVNVWRHMQAISQLSEVHFFIIKSSLHSHIEASEHIDATYNGFSLRIRFFIDDRFGSVCLKDWPFFLLYIVLLCMTCTASKSEYSIHWRFIKLRWIMPTSKAHHYDFFLFSAVNFQITKVNRRRRQRGVFRALELLPFHQYFWRPFSVRSAVDISWCEWARAFCGAENLFFKSLLSKFVSGAPRLGAAPWLLDFAHVENQWAME